MTMAGIAQEVRHGALAAAVFVALAAPGGVGAQGAGSITGVVTARATALRPLRVTIDQRVCGDELPDETVLVSATGSLANAVVTLVGVKAPSNAASAGIMNEKCRFVPRVQIVRPNAAVTTSSSDPMLHTTNAQLGNKVLFNVAVPVPGIKINKRVSGAGLVRLSCNTHPWMRGWMLVTDDMAAVTDAQGRFTLPNVPAGTYELRIWHEALKGAAQKVTVAANQTAAVTFVMQ